jgi:putative oxidoreductase
MLDSVFSPFAGWGPLVLRLALGVTLIVHGWLKVNPKGQTKGPAGFAAWLKQMRVPLPLFFAWVVCLLETVGAVLLVLGLGTRILALGVVIDMLVAIALVKMKMMNARFMDTKVQGWEFEFALLAQALALVVLGAGSIALDPLVGL